VSHGYFVQRALQRSIFEAQGAAPHGDVVQAYRGSAVGAMQMQMSHALADSAADTNGE